MVTAMARDGTESRFREVLERFGGPQRVLLVGELWDRGESRALLEGFLRELFPTELVDGADLFRAKGSTVPVSPCKRDAAPAPASQATGATRLQSPTPAPDRTLVFGLVFFLCRPESLLLPGSRLQLREILRDVRKRMAGGCAVIGVIMRPDNAAGRTEESPGVISEHSPPACSAVPSLLSLLQSVFQLKGRGGQCSEVRAAALVPGHEEARREIQRLACEALTAAADEQRRPRPKVKSRCFSWRRWTQKDSLQKENHEEGTALTVLQYPNGDCVETTTEA